MEFKQCKSLVEAMLFAYAEPVSANKLGQAIDVPEDLIQKVLLSIRDDCDSAERGVTLLSVEDRWQMVTKTPCADAVKNLMETKRNTPLSPAAMEVLAIIAYNQPVSRSFVEQVRGVDSSSTVQTLIQKGLVEEAGRLDLPGKPISFSTTDLFLRTFDLTSLSQLPPVHGSSPLEDVAIERAKDDAEKQMLSQMPNKEEEA